MIAWNGVEKWFKNQDIVPYHQVFQVGVHPRVPFGSDISDQVKEENIKVKSLDFLKREFNPKILRVRSVRPSRNSGSTLGNKEKDIYEIPDLGNKL